MRAVLSGEGVRVFVHAVHCMAKVGGQVYLAASNDSIRLRALSDARQAFLGITLRPSFFTAYSHDGRVQHCQLSVKNLQSALKSVRTVEELHLALCQEGHNHVLQLRLCCTHGLVKVHNLLFEESESYQVIVDAEQCDSHVTARPEQLSEAIDHMRGADDVVVDAVERELRVRNVRAEADDGGEGAAGGGAMMSETVVRADRFEAYSVSSNAPMELSVREVKAFLGFCRAKPVSMSTVALHFSGGGSPLLLMTDDPQKPFHARLVVSTSSTAAEAGSASGGEAAGSAAHAEVAEAAAKRPRRADDEGSGSAKRPVRAA